MSNFMIVRGFPGSGKSTYVMREYTGLMFFETDMFNIVNGQYVWTVDRSREAIRLINEFTTSIFNSPNRPDFALCGVFGTFKNIINQTDKTAYVTVHIAHEINGEGWTR